MNVLKESSVSTYLVTDEFFHWVSYNEPGVFHFSYQGITVCRISKYRCTSVPEDCFIFTNSSEPDEMPCSGYVAFQPLSSLFAKISQLSDFLYTKG